MKSLIRNYTIYILHLFLLLLLISCNTSGQQAEGAAQAGDNAGLILPEGFKAVVVADNLGPGRHIDINENGDIYMTLQSMSSGHGIVALRDTSGDSHADVVEYFGNYAGTGMEVHDGYLYFGGDTMILRYRLSPGRLLPQEEPVVLAGGFPMQNQHSDKTFAIDDKGYIYANVGAPSNACMERTRTRGSPGIDPCPQLNRQAGIWRFSLNRMNQRQAEDGYRYATGIRNAVALDWNVKEAELYAVMHGRDQLHQFFPDLYTEEENAQLPSEEFLLVREGSDFGWPYCYYDHLKGQKVLAPEYGGDGNITGRCEDKDDPIMGFPGHLAPNDLLFYTGTQYPEKYRNGAFICFHGSWNRAPLEQEGFYVAFVPFGGELPSGDWEVFAGGFAGTDYVSSPSEAEYRPMGIAMGKDGSLYVSDSKKGRIWKIFYDN